MRPNGTAEILVDLAQVLPAQGRRTPAANGIKIDDRGNLIVAESGTGHVLRVSNDGKQVDVLVGDFEGDALQSVNDVALDRGGAVYFSCGPLLMTGRLKPWTGGVVAMNPEPLFSNGVAVSPDGKWLIVGDSTGRQVVIMEIFDGTGRRPRTLIDFLPPGYPRELSRQQQAELTAKKVAIPDGMVFDEFGRLWLTTWDAGVVHVLEVPSGKVLATYNVGAGKVSNLHFYKGDLYVTADGALWKLPVGVRGWRYSRGCGN